MFDFFVLLLLCFYFFVQNTLFIAKYCNSFYNVNLFSILNVLRDLWSIIRVKRYKPSIFKRCSNKYCCKHYRQVNINWRDVQRKNVVNNVDMSSLRAPWQNGPYKNQHTERQKARRTPWRNIHLEKTILCVCFWFFFFLFFFIDNFLNDFSKSCWVTAFVRSMTYIGGLYQF